MGGHVSALSAFDFPRSSRPRTKTSTISTRRPSPQAIADLPAEWAACDAATPADEQPVRRLRSGNGQARRAVSGVSDRRWYWRFLLVLGIALALDLLVDDKLLFAGLMLIWIGACAFSLRRLRRARLQR